MPTTPLNREQAEEIAVRWLADQLPEHEAAEGEISGWLDWETADLAFVVDVHVPGPVVAELGAKRFRAPRFDLPADDADSGEAGPVTEAHIDVDDLRLVVDRHTGDVVAGASAVSISQTLEEWRRAKGLDEENGAAVPAYEGEPRTADRA